MSGERRAEHDVYVPVDGALSEQSGDRVVVLHADGQRMSTLSPVGGAVWRRLPGSLDDIVDTLAAWFPGVDRDTLYVDAGVFLDETVALGLVRIERDHRC